MVSLSPLEIDDNWDPPVAENELEGRSSYVQGNFLPSDFLQHISKSTGNEDPGYAIGQNSGPDSENQKQGDLDSIKLQWETESRRQELLRHIFPEGFTQNYTNSFEKVPTINPTPCLKGSITSLTGVHTEWELSSVSPPRRQGTDDDAKESIQTDIACVSSGDPGIALPPPLRQEGNAAFREHKEWGSGSNQGSWTEGCVKEDPEILRRNIRTSPTLLSTTKNSAEDNQSPTSEGLDWHVTLPESEQKLQDALDRCNSRLHDRIGKIKSLERRLQEAMVSESSRSALVKKVTQLEGEVSYLQQRLDVRQADALGWRDQRQELEVETRRLVGEIHLSSERNARLETEARRQEVELCETRASMDDLKQSVTGLRAEIREKEALLKAAVDDSRRAWEATALAREAATAAGRRAAALEEGMSKRCISIEGGTNIVKGNVESSTTGGAMATERRGLQAALLVEKGAKEMSVTKHQVSSPYGSNSQQDITPHQQGPSSSSGRALSYTEANIVHDSTAGKDAGTNAARHTVSPLESGLCGLMSMEKPSPPQLEQHTVPKDNIHKQGGELNRSLPSEGARGASTAASVESDNLKTRGPAGGVRYSLHTPGNIVVGEKGVGGMQKPEADVRRANIMEVPAAGQRLGQTVLCSQRSSLVGSGVGIKENSGPGDNRTGGGPLLEPRHQKSPQTLLSNVYSRGAGGGTTGAEKDLSSVESLVGKEERVGREINPLRVKQPCTLVDKVAPLKPPRGLNGQREKSTAPFATDAVQQELQSVKALERNLMLLQMEASQLDAEQMKLVPKAFKTIKGRLRMQEIEDRLAHLGKETSDVRMSLRSTRPI